MNDTTRGYIRQATTALVALALVLSVFGPVGTVAADPSVSIEQTADSTTVAPGETVTLTTQFGVAELNAPQMSVGLPDGWEITGQTAEGPVSYDGDGTWTWLAGDDDGVDVSYAIEYTVSVPGDASGEYTITADGSALSPDGAQTAGGDSTTITVEEPDQNEGPSASFTASPSSPEAGETVAFDASASSDADGTIDSYEWDFGDGQTATGESASHAYDDAGDYDVTLTVTDDDGATDTTTQTVTVSEPEPENQSPTASFTADPAAPDVGEDVTLDASNSADSDGSIANYEWDFDGDGTTDATGETTTTSFASAGDYDVTLTVTDGDGATDTATQTISVADAPVANQPPTASFTVSPSSPDVDEDVTLDASASQDSDGSIASYEWAVDGSALATGETTTTSFDSAGDYDVTLTVTDDGGETDTATQTVSVADAPVAPGSGIGVSLEPSESTITEGESDEFDIVVSNLEGGSVGAYDITLALSDGGVATFDGVEVDGESIGGDDSDLTDVTETSDTIRIEVAGQSVAGAEAVIGTVNVSGDAPGEVDVSVQEALVYDESGDGYEIGSTEGVTMTVEELQEPFFEVSSLDAPDEVAQGDDITVTATVTNTGELTGTKTVSFEFDGATVDSEDVELDPGASTDVSFTVSSGEISAGTYTHGVVTEDGNATADITITPPALGEFENPPGDLDGDGLYEDVNGDGEFDMGDAQALFANRNTDAVQNNVAAFDFNGDGVVDVGDVQALFDQLI
jgi:PKD repeat protein